MTCIVASEFDSKAFGLPYHRVWRFDLPALQAELRPLLQRRPIVIDAKCPAEQIDQAQFLLRHGFRRITTQVVLEHDLQGIEAAPDDVIVAERMAVDPDLLEAHVANLSINRFRLDPLLPVAGCEAVYRAWLTNSLASGAKRVAYRGGSFCSFSADANGAAIDLVSVVDQGKGVAGTLLRAVLAQTRSAGASKLTVVTDCENRRAWRAYQRAGFAVAAFVAVLHFVRL